MFESKIHIQFISMSAKLASGKKGYLPSLSLIMSELDIYFYSQLKKFIHNFLAYFCEEI
jgi:hypothetical protein